MSAASYSSLLKLIDQCRILYEFKAFDVAHRAGSVCEQAREIATKLARELFPPMAKALVWQVNGDDICSQRIDGCWYRIKRFPSICPSDDLLINCALCGNGLADSLQWCATIDEAKAWCESRHQTKFRELCA